MYEYLLQAHTTIVPTFLFPLQLNIQPKHKFLHWEFIANFHRVANIHASAHCDICTESRKHQLYVYSYTSNISPSVNTVLPGSQKKKKKHFALTHTPSTTAYTHTAPQTFIRPRYAYSVFFITRLLTIPRWIFFSCLNNGTGDGAVRCCYIYV